MNEDQLNDANRVAYLFAGYIRNNLTDAERDELDEWVEASDDNMRLFVEMTDEKNIEKGLKERGVYDVDKAFQKLKEKINEKEGQHTSARSKFWIYSVAACIAILIGAFVLEKWIAPHKKPLKQMAEQKDLAPGGNKAILTLADGKQIVLDSAKGNIVQQESLKIINDDGKLSYQGTSDAVEFNTVITPRGGQYRITLADGTSVWLNAASSLKYPTSFAGNERIVELTGEGYFEVAKDKNKPFRVKLKNDALVEVLGTHFNINAYDDEQQIRTTLLEGNVKVSQLSTHNSVLISPGQQAVIGNEQLTTNNDADLDEVTAWKNNKFEFHHEPIDAIMRQVARWYDVTIKYEGVPTDHFNATVSRNVPVSKLFHFLELTKRVHFTIEDKTIIVKP